MKRFKTLRVRFALWTAGLLLAAFILFGALVYFSLARSLIASVDNGLAAVASRIALNAKEEADSENLAIGLDLYIEELEDADLVEGPYTVQILSLDGEPLAEVGPPHDISMPNRPPPTEPGQSTFYTVTDPHSADQFRVYSTPIVGNDQIIGIIHAGQSMAEIQAALDRLLTIFFVSVPMVILFATLGGYLLAARALAPIDKITQTAQHISGKDLSARLNLSATDDEVGRLAATFDRMLARLDNAFKRERQFTADASHELRTPLAAIQTILSSTLTRRRTPPEYEQALSDVGEEAERMRTLTEGLLLLARDDVPTAADFETVDLSDLLEDVTTSLRPLAEDKAVKLICNIPTDLTLPGDSDRLIRVFANLLGNAIKFTNQGQIIVRAGQNNNGTITVMVGDTGIGIPAEHLPYLFDRFYRVDKSRAAPGTGLGLAIAMDAVQAHNGTITVTSDVGQGTTFEVQLATEMGQ